MPQKMTNQNILKFKDKKYFIKLLKSFSSKTHILFEISNEFIKISSLDPPYIYLTIPDDVFSIKFPVEFTINAVELIKNIDILKCDYAILNQSFKIVRTPDSFDAFVDIPFINPIKSSYCNLYDFTTKFIMDKSLIKCLLQGRVNYQCESSLILKSTNNSFEEKMVVEVDYIQMNYLNFTTYNNWMILTAPFYDLIDTVLFEFSDELMCVNFLMKEHPSTFIEIQCLSVHC